MERMLLEELKKYSDTDYYPLHMPGHKRNFRLMENPYAIDITEIHGFDNLFHAEDLLLEAQKRASRLYESDETFYLVNGSTCGILAAVSASVTRGGQILMARNCHKAAYHAVLLNGLNVSYLYPSVDMKLGMFGAIEPEEVRQVLAKTRNPVQAVLITSPTYDGVVSDITAIAEIVHGAGAVLIVDEAHGAHFAMDPYFPQSALSLGADIVINSLHKTMPSLTQTALLHVKGERADREKLKKYLSIYQSSSPSYVLMAGMDACVSLMLEQKKELFGVFVQRLKRLRDSLQQMKHLCLVTGTEANLNAWTYDGSKVIISTENCRLNGPELGRMLREKYHMEPEMEAEQYVTAIMTVADSQEGFDRLEQALLEIDQSLSSDQSWMIHKKEEYASECWTRNEEVMTIEQAENAHRKRVHLQESTDKISGEFVYLYPPGIPILVPGERIGEGMPEQINYYRSIGLNVQGMQDYTGEYIVTVDEMSVEDKDIAVIER